MHILMNTEQSLLDYYKHILLADLFLFAGAKFIYQIIPRISQNICTIMINVLNYTAIFCS